MQNYSIAKTEKSPSIVFDAAKGALKIKGNSILSNTATAFYKPLLDIVENYVAQPKAKTVISFQFDYLDSESAKRILAMLKILEGAAHGDNTVDVKWFYSNQDMENMGNNYRMIIKLDFQIVPATN